MTETATETESPATAAASQPLLLSWDQAADAGPVAAGGKGWNAGLLDRYGLPVPPGGVLSTAAYRAFVEHTGLAPEAAALEAAPLDDPDLEARLTAFRERMTDAPLPQEVEAALGAALALPGLDAPLAVRSSASAEDGSDASFAGMHHTALNVAPALPHIFAAIKACYASLWTVHALTYRQKRGLAGVEMAVVLMRLIPARAAGVAFSADPRTGRQDHVIVTANFGLGESVVGGVADPDEITIGLAIDRPLHIVSRRTGRKERRTQLLDDGGTTQGEAAADGAAMAISDEVALEVAQLALRCQDAVGEDYAPQDVEWADDGERRWIVQSRPITALRGFVPPLLAGQRTIWSTGNIKEVIAPVPSPYMWSMIRMSVGILMESTVARTGYQMPPGARWIRLYMGHPYFNLSLMQWMFFDSFGIEPERFNQLLGGQQPAIRIPQKPYSGREGLTRLRRVLSQLADAGKAFKEIPLVIAEHEAYHRRKLAEDVTTLSDEQILAFLNESGGRYLEFSPQFMRANSHAGNWLDNLTTTLERLLPDRGQALGTRLLAASGGVASAEQGYRLAALARLAAADERARRFFLTAQSLPNPNAIDLAEDAVPPAPDPARPLATDWERALAGTEAGRAMAAFLQEFGHRAVDELEIAVPRWVEDPSYIVETVRQHIQSGLDAPPEHHAAAARQEAERELRAALRFHPMRPVVSWLLNRARRASALRENTKSILVLSMLPLRRMTTELARRLVQRGLLDIPEDAFFLTMWENMALVSGRWDGRGARRLVADRRARNRALYRLRLPDVILDDEPQPAQSTAVASAAGGEVYAGIGVAAGTAAGRARVVRHPREGIALQKGEILVAPTTDPGWTPLFLRAAGLVMETGGFLSHGAIVAREYGIPAVANLPGIMDTLRDGDSLVVDGNTGHLTRANTAPT